MKLARWKEVAELAGIIAIVGSLLFVGLQMKQSQEIAIAAQYQERSNAALDFFLARMSSERALRIYGERIGGNLISVDSLAGSENLIEKDTPESIGFLYVTFRQNMTMHDNSHFQYESGFMTEEAWLALRERLRSLLSDEFMAALFLRETSAHRPSFQAMVAELLEEIESEQELPHN